MKGLSNIYEEIINESQETEFIAYHGSPNEISKFSDSFVDGEDVTQHHGPGIYFATSYENARMFGKHMHKVKLSGKFIDTDTSIRNVDVNELIALMKMSGDEPDEWEMEAQNYDENPNIGIQKAAKYAIQSSGDEAGAFFAVLNGWYRSEGIRYIRNMTKLGYDGLVVDAPRDWVGEKHIIVFNPSCIKLIK